MVVLVYPLVAFPSYGHPYLSYSQPVRSVFGASTSLDRYKLFYFDMFACVGHTIQCVVIASMFYMGPISEMEGVLFN